MVVLQMEECSTSPTIRYCSTNTRTSNMHILLSSCIVAVRQQFFDDNAFRDSVDLLRLAIKVIT